MVQPNDEVDLIEREREDGQKVRSVRVWSPSCVGWADWQHVQMPPTVHAHPFPLSSFWGINCRLNRPFRKFNFDHNLSHSHPFLSLSPFECSKLTYPLHVYLVYNYQKHINNNKVLFQQEKLVHELWICFMYKK